MGNKKNDWGPVRHLEDLIANLASLIIRLHVILLQADSHGSYDQIYIEAKEALRELGRMQTIYAAHFPQIAGLLRSPNGRLRENDLNRQADYLNTIAILADRHGNYDRIYLNAAQCFYELGRLRNTLSSHWHEAVDTLRGKYDPKES